MLSQITPLLAERGRMTLRELALHFAMEPDALEPMLSLLVQKGRIQQNDPACGATCAGCDCATRIDMVSYDVTQETPTP